MLGRYHKSEGYHERCTEEILSELLEMNFNAKKVEAFFERRGGIAIIPVRHK
jgi:NADPH-dependent 7-cyano-7-deazaguanine reductase QueF